MNKKEDNNLSWDLEKLLDGTTFESLKESYFNAQNEIINIYKKNPFADKDIFQKFHNYNLESSIISNKLINYISNNYNTDLANNKWFLEMQDIQHRSINNLQEISDFTNNVINNKEKIQEYLKDKNLSYLTRYYELIFREEKHLLSPEIKKFAATYTCLEDSYEVVFTSLLDKELTVQSAKDSKNKKHTIENRSKYIKLLTNKDRKLRENVYKNWHSAIFNIRESLAKLIYFNFLEKNVNAKNSKFPGGYYESCVFSDELPENFIPNIYKRISNFTQYYKKYKKVKRELLKKTYSIDKLKPWDSRMPIVKTKESKISIDKAKELTLSALSLLGSEYTNNLKKAFKERWIDWLPRKNKISGAYCISNTYGLESKYVLLNYNYKLDDVYTLVHELGHALHSVEFTKSQTLYAESSIFITEIASILNEMLLSFYLLEKFSKNHKKQLEIYDNLISNFFSTTISQIIYSEWEYEINKLINEGKAIDAKLAENIFYEKQKKYYGYKEKKINELEKKSLSSILTVPHFYSGNFYLYKYAVGQIVSLVTAYRIYREGSDSPFIKKYFKFLASGNSLSNLETLKIIDIDLDDNDIWRKTEIILSQWISKYTKLSQKI